MHEYVIIGAGPSGLTLGWYLAKFGKRVLIIDREDSIGGCHRVKRTQDGLFTEHAPRVYFGNYLQFITLLKDIGLDFSTSFAKYKFYSGGYYFLKTSGVSVCELLLFGKEYLKFMVNPSYAKHTTVKQFLDSNNISHRVKLYTDLLCRIIDGAGADRFTLYELFDTFNTTIFYGTYIPRYPNDVNLFQKWKDSLIGTGLVDIMLNTSITRLNYSSGRITSITTDKGETINGSQFILAIPPTKIRDILSNSHPVVKGSFGPFTDFNRWANYTNYITGVSLTFHWDKDLKLPPVWGGLTDPEWGLIFINMSDYTTFNHPLSKCVISTTVTITDRVSKYNNKTVNQCTEDELKQVILLKLREVYPDLPQPTRIILSPEGYYADGVWLGRDTAFVRTVEGFMDAKSNLPNLYTVGHHTGGSSYSFTSLEGAVTNGVALANYLVPDANIPINTPVTFNQVIFLTVLFLLIVYLCLRTNL